MEQAKEYYAFISYQRKDEEWAERLRNKLEHYHLPSGVRKQDTSLPKEIRPVFRDTLELAGGVLAKEIEMALQNSKFLIVICSPNSAKSPWVNKEVQTFIDLGREDRIIPFIIDGSPFSNDSTTECFPPSLQSLKDEKEILGININEMGRDAAAVKVVARMFGLKFDALWQRYERENRRKRWMIIGGALMVALVSLALVLYISSINREVRSERDRANSERDRANSERDRAETANASLKLANDSISSQNVLILNQRDSLNTYNIQLLEERTRVLLASYKTQEQYLLLASQKAKEMMDKGDYIGAKNQLLQIESLNMEIPIYTPEIEQALRRTEESNSGIIKAHISPIKKARLSPDGKIVVSCANNENIKLWNTHTGKLLYSIANKEYSPGIIFSPNGHLVISYKDSISIWSIDDFKQVYSFPYKGGIIRDIDTTNRILLVDGNGVNKLNIIDGTSGQLITSIQTTYKQFISSAYFLSNDMVVTAALDDSIRIYDINEQSIVRKWKAHEYGVNFISLNKDKTKIISGEFGKLSFNEPLVKSDSLKIWDTQSGHLLSAFPISVKNAIFSPDGRNIIAIKGKDIVIIDAKGGNEINTINGHDTHITDLDINRNGTLLISASSDDSVIRLWDEYYLNLTTREQKKGSIYTLPSSFYPKGDKFLVSSGDSLMLFNFDAGKVKFVKKFGTKYTPMLSSIRFDSLGKRFITTDGIATIWDAAFLKPICRIRTFNPKYAEISPNGRLAVTVRDYHNMVYLWDISKGDSLIDKPAHSITAGNKKTHVNTASFSPDGKFLVTAHNDGLIKIWEMNNFTCVDSLIGHTISANTAFYSHDGRYVLSASADRSVKIWDMTTKKCINSLVGHTAEVCYAELSKDDKLVISTSFDNSLIIWDAKSGLPLKKYHSQGSTASFSPDNKFILLVDSSNSFKILPYHSTQDLWSKMKLQME